MDIALERPFRWRTRPVTGADFISLSHLSLPLCLIRFGRGARGRPMDAGWTSQGGCTSTMRSSAADLHWIPPDPRGFLFLFSLENLGLFDIDPEKRFCVFFYYLARQAKGDLYYQQCTRKRDVDKGAFDHL